jgi:hypothetical protein
MKRIAVAILLAFKLIAAHKLTDGFTPASTNVWGAQYPRVDASRPSRVSHQGPGATTVKAQFLEQSETRHGKGSRRILDRYHPTPRSRFPLLQLRRRWSGRERCGKPCLLRRRQRRERHRDSRTGRNLLSAAGCSARSRARDLVFLKGHRRLASCRSSICRRATTRRPRCATRCSICSTAAAKMRLAGSSRAMPISSSTT